ncbi:MAG: imidazole glycerol phosphate synthase subunit HisH [SAR324 cluster bacterium]
MIAIIDYNVGNLHNLKNALDYQGLPNAIVHDAEEVARAERIILPGVGAFWPAMEHLKKAGLEQVVRERVGAGVPFLGVCVGMQLLFDEGEEDGLHPGLGFIPGRVVRFSGTLKVPQIGWNQVAWQRPDPLLEGIPDGSYFYFVHSYHAQLARPRDALGISEYSEAFPAIVRRGNVWGAQFHPEKSQAAGLRLLKNFATLQPA